ncbi:hypothetical protein F0562_028377 [Nyssa sinensis]|uniref:Uncharacterized protein n=1 Tax=Nyssa sinensis TaxID=561372 RepID=A0A5J5B7X7_9ASTE|nr:hypothetical protein F0562_028377 [Nyssa sinensis]
MVRSDMVRNDEAYVNEHELLLVVRPLPGHLIGKIGSVIGGYGDFSCTVCVRTTTSFDLFYHKYMILGHKFLDDTPNVPPPLWQPSFSTWTSPITFNNSMMQDDLVAVALGLVSPCDEGLLTVRTNANVVYDSLVLYVRAINSVLIMAQRLYARDAVI